MHITVKIKYAENFSKEHLAKIKKCASLIECVVNTEEFKNLVINYQYNPIKTVGRLWFKKTVIGDPVKSFYFESYQKHFSNEEVYQKIMSGWEEGNPEEDGVIDLMLACKYNGWTSATAYGYPSDDKITIHSWWINKSTVAELSNTLLHEWLHNCGFEHDFKWNMMRDHSVPYAVGKILENIITKKINTGELNETY